MNETNINSISFWHTHLTGIFKKSKAGDTVCDKSENKSDLA